MHEDSSENLTDLTSGRKITRNSILNLIGFCVPLLVAVLTIPVIVREMGTDRFGILTLAWAVIGYFSLFDFGLNRALTQLVAQKLGKGEKTQIPTLIWTSIVVMMGLGIMVSGILLILLPWLIQNVLSIPEALIRETLIAFRLLALSVPLVIVSVGLRGVLGAYQKFDLINWVRLPMGIYSFLVPIPIVMWYSPELHPVVAALILGRLVAVLIQLRFCLNLVRFIGSGVRFRRDLIRPLLSYGGWITISNMISPLMIFIDRFFISALIGASAVAFYATPNEAATKLWFIPWAVLGVLFPAFSTSLVTDRQLAVGLFDNGLKYLFIIMFPIALMVIAFSSEGLGIWLGGDFAIRSADILQWIVVGVFLHSLAQVPYALLQGAGRPDIIAKMHVVELPIYCILLWQMIQWKGAMGAAIAWTIRLGVDALVVLLFSYTVLPIGIDNRKRKVATVFLALSSFLLISRIEALVYRSVFSLIILLFFVFFVWFILFKDQDRNRIIKGLFHAHR